MQMLLSSRNCGLTISATLVEQMPFARALLEFPLLTRERLQTRDRAVDFAEINLSRRLLDRLEHIFALLFAHAHLDAGLDAERFGQAHRDRIARFEGPGWLHWPAFLYT